MKQGLNYTNENQYPQNAFDSNLKIAKKISRCSCEPVAYRELICYATQDLKVHVLNAATLETVKEIKLKKAGTAKERTSAGNYSYLFVHKDILLIQAPWSLYRYDFEKDLLEPISDYDGLVVLNTAVTIGDSVFFVRSRNGKDFLQKLEISSGEIKVLTELEKMPNILTASGKNLLYNNNTHVICFDSVEGKELWRTEIASHGNYLDPIWKKQTPGNISNQFFIAEDSLTLSVEREIIINLDLANGKTNWILPIKESDLPRLTYVAGDDSFFYMANNIGQVELKTGRIMRTYELAETLDKKKLAPGPVGVSEKYFYISSAYQKPALIIVNRQSGKIEETHSLEDHSHTPPAIIGNYLTMFDYSSNLYFFSSESK